MSEIRCDYTDNITCPYCGHEREADGDDNHTEDSEETECYNCEKSFLYRASISVSWCSKKADCLNDGKHQFRDWKDVGVDDFYYRTCDTCSKRETVKGKPV